MAVTVDQIDAEINTLIAKQQVDYSVGDKSYSNGDKIRQLLELRRSLAETPQVELDVMQFDCEIGLDGTDRTQFTVL